MQSDLLKAASPVVFAYNGGIGDRLCNLPALRALASLFPRRLALACEKGDRELYYADLDLRAVYEVNLQRAGKGWNFDPWDLVHRIGKCDLLLCLNPWHNGSTSELLAALPRISSVGFFREFRHHLPCDYQGHAMDMGFAVPAFLDQTLRLADFSQPPVLPLSALISAREFKRAHATTPRTLFVHADTYPAKRWRPDRFARVLDRFLREFPDFTALVVDRGERFGSPRFHERMLPFNLPLDVSFALLGEADLFLGVDSCHLHAADLFRVPSVALFGPTSCRRWGYKFAEHWHLQGSGRMDDIGVDDVSKALNSLADARDAKARLRKPMASVAPALQA
jgi:ADP-heptose:LPS heptosyltransferase